MQSNTTFDDFTSRCVSAFNESDATLSSARLLLYKDDEDCRAAEVMLNDLRLLGCCGGGSPVPDVVATAAPVTNAPVAPSVANVPVPAPSTQPTETSLTMTPSTNPTLPRTTLTSPTSDDSSASKLCPGCVIAAIIFATISAIFGHL